jgi:cell division cycle protein 20 (cofactor of APC complex)
MEPDLPHFNLSKENQAAETSATPNKEQYKEMLAASLSLGEQSRILAFKHKAPAPPEGHVSHLAPLYSNNLGQAPSRKHYRHIPQTQERILDAPDLVDDYYLNLVDWSSGNQVSIRTLATAGRSHHSCSTAVLAEQCSCHGLLSFADCRTHSLRGFELGSVSW